MALSVPVQAHPHVFIDAGLHFLFDDKGQLAAVRVVWVYDAFYSLLLIEEKGLDPDGDGVLTEAELLTLSGFDLVWEPDFPGDMELRSAGGDIVELGRPMSGTAAYENGRIITTHIRPLIHRERPDHSDGISAKVFDPTYFVAYDLRLETRIETEQTCKVNIVKIDIKKVGLQVDQEYFGSDADEFADGEYPEVGELFADKVVLTCAPSS